LENKPVKVKKAKKSSASESESRHSCDELMMTRSLYESGEASDTGSQVSSSGRGHHDHGEEDCQRCYLNTLSNRTMSLDCNELVNSARLDIFLDFLDFFEISMAQWFDTVVRRVP
jgi:hypothetical protein